MFDFRAEHIFSILCLLLNLVLKLYQIHLRLDPSEKDSYLQLSVNFSFRMEMRRQREQGNFDYSEKLKKKKSKFMECF